MPGVSLTVLLLPRAEESDQFTAEKILGCLDDKPEVMAWNMAVKVNTVQKQTEDNDTEARARGTRYSQRSIRVSSPESFVNRIKSACEALQEAEPIITKMDQVAGDGDCGTTLKNGADGILQMIANARITGTNLIDDVQAISDTVGERMDGTSGALYS
jgi:dihydroxyacetone kinase